MKEQPEKTLESKEQPTSKIVLEIFRHGERQRSKDVPNEELRLTEKGRKQADKKGKGIKPSPEVSVAVGSPRPRSQETAVRVMLAEKDKITPAMSLEEIEEVINSESKYGKKIISDPRLDFNVEGPVGEKADKAYDEGRTMEYLVYESDTDAIKFKDKKSTTYTGAAGDLAEIIKKYVRIAPNFDKLVEKNPEKYARYNNQMERYLGSHQSVIEPFLIKAIEKVRGTEYKDEFVKSLGAGFEDIEGFRVEINNTTQGVKLEIKYEMNDKQESVEASPEILEEIIKERDELEKKIKES